MRRILWRADHRCATCGLNGWPGCLQHLGEFSGKSAFGFMLALSASATLGPVCGWGGGGGALFRFGGAHGTRTLDYAFGRLSRVCAEDFVLERGAVEAADDGLHFVRSGRFNKRESF